MPNITLNYSLGFSGSPIRGEGHPVPCLKLLAVIRPRGSPDPVHPSILTDQILSYRQGKNGRLLFRAGLNHGKDSHHAG